MADILAPQEVEYHRQAGVFRYALIDSHESLRAERDAMSAEVDKLRHFVRLASEQYERDQAYIAKCRDAAYAADAEGKRLRARVEQLETALRLVRGW